MNLLAIERSLWTCRLSGRVTASWSKRDIINLYQRYQHLQVSEVEADPCVRERSVALVTCWFRYFGPGTDMRLVGASQFGCDLSPPLKGCSAL